MADPFIVRTTFGGSVGKPVVMRAPAAPAP